jgi:hypothetical protein
MSRQRSEARFLRRQPKDDQFIVLRSPATCVVCEREIARGERVQYLGRDVPYRHETCGEEST